MSTLILASAALSQFANRTASSSAPQSPDSGSMQAVRKPPKERFARPCSGGVAAFMTLISNQGLRSSARAATQWAMPREARKRSRDANGISTY